MIVLTNTTAQILASGQSITFDNVVLHTGCGECHKDSTASVKLRSRGIYEIHFNGNVTSVTAADSIQLSILAGGDPIVGTAMNSSTSAATSLSVSATTLYANSCGDYSRITVTNTGDNPLVIQAGSNLYIKRVS